jgi:hypothetical protein
LAVVTRFSNSPKKGSRSVADVERLCCTDRLVGRFELRRWVA